MNENPDRQMLGHPVRTAHDRLRVVIIGGGFAGLEAARRLGGAAIDVTLVDQRNHHVFQPLLYQVATSGLAPQDIAWPLRASLRRHHNVTVRLGTVVGVDWDERAVVLADGGRLPFERLVIAVGSVTTDFGIPGVAEHALSLKDLDDATRLRNHLVGRFEEASRCPTTVPDGPLRFTVIGGGPTGVELAGALTELAAVLGRDFPEVDTSRLEIVLVEQGDRLLHGFEGGLQRYTAATLQRRGIRVVLSTAVEQITPGRVHLVGGEVVRTGTVLWAAGVRAHPLAEELDVELTRGGRIVVDERLRIPGRPEVFAVGDIAAGLGPSGELLPQTSPVAIQQGRHVARTILASSRSRSSTPFRYVDKGRMATIGRHAAVAEMIGLRLHGLSAWISWLLVHLMYLRGFRNRAGVLLQWVWSYVTNDRSARAVFGATALPGPAIGPAMRRRDRDPGEEDGPRTASAASVPSHAP